MLGVAGAVWLMGTVKPLYLRDVFPVLLSDSV
jgi:N-acyl-L-homoserine lactone synthetase